MRFRLISFAGLLNEASLRVLSVTTYEGAMVVLPNHEPLIALLPPGEIVFTALGGEYVWRISEGFLVVTPDEVQVIVREAEVI